MTHELKEKIGRKIGVLFDDGNQPSQGTLSKVGDDSILQRGFIIILKDECEELIPINRISSIVIYKDRP